MVSCDMYCRVQQDLMENLDRLDLQEILGIKALRGCEGSQDQEAKRSAALVNIYLLVVTIIGTIKANKKETN